IATNSVWLQAKIHELLALVYYDGLQNVVPFYDQRSMVPAKDTSWIMEDWSHAFYLGKLCEKLGYSHDISFSYYGKAIALNPLAIDPFYMMHASHLKLLYTVGKQNEQAIKVSFFVKLTVVAAYSFTQSIKDTVMNMFDRMDLETSQLPVDVEGSIDANSDYKLEEVWHMLYDDCLSALKICVDGDLKYFHKARYLLAQGLYRRVESGDLEKAKEELCFCFKSSRSSFTINMWEIDGMVKKGRWKTIGLSGNMKVLEVNLPESS
ncbi:unnamed protein product, partial [Ilex paraguariensis]